MRRAIFERMQNSFIEHALVRDMLVNDHDAGLDLAENIFIMHLPKGRTVGENFRGYSPAFRCRRWRSYWRRCVAGGQRLARNKTRRRTTKKILRGFSEKPVERL